MALVIDASVAIGWLIASQADAVSDAALDEVVRSYGSVPASFAFEIGRVLRRRERFHGLGPQEFDEMVADLRALRLVVDQANPMDRLSAVAALTRRYVISFADAAYLELAGRMDLPLATRDQGLARAAEVANIRLFTPPAV